MSGAWQNCCCGQRYEDGMVVLASKRSYGFAGPQWNIAPAVFPKIYRRLHASNSLDRYYADGFGGWTYWMTATNDITIDVHPLFGTVMHILVTGSHNGRLFEQTRDPVSWELTTYVKPLDEYTIETGPLGDTTIADILPVTTVGTPSVTAVGDGTITSEDRYTDSGGLASLFTSTVTGEDGLDPAAIASEVAAMMAAIPLQVANQLTSLARDGNDLPMSGYIGFQQTQQAPWLGNLIVISYPLNEGPDQSMRLVAQPISTTDHDCVAGQAREQSFTPAAMQVDLPGGGSGNGVPFVVGDAAFVLLLYFSGAGVAYPTRVGAIGYGKKALLARVAADHDDWTLLRPQDSISKAWGDAICLSPPGGVDAWLRYYYPAAADSGGSGANTISFSFLGDGMIYREIPYFAPPLPGNCPTGLLGFFNPCL